MSVRTDVVNLMVNVGGDKAKDELNQLRKKAADISAEMKGLKKGTADYIAKNNELKYVRDEMDKVRKSIGLAAMTQKELTSELAKLKAMRGSLTPQTKEFDDLSKKIKETENRLFEVKNGAFGFQATLKKVGTELKAFGLMAAAYLGFEFITDAFKTILSGAGKLSDQLADVRRVTGLSDASVKQLNQTFRAFDTRTANSQLLDYAKIAGKLGIASDQIGGFVQATDQLVTALGDELGDANTISENIGKIINIYDKGAQVTGERTLQIGNAIVDLANKGVASGNFIVDFTKRLAGIANTANVGLDASIGLAAGLEELGQTSESSSTAVTQLITKIGGDVSKYAALAGKSAKEFGETLRNSPVEALIQLGEGLTKNKNGFADIAIAFKDAEASGVRVTSTLGVIGQKADFLRGKIATAGDALTNTTQITNAYALKNETLGATLDKIGKRISSVFTSRALTDFLSSAARGFAQLIGAVEKSGTALDQFHTQSTKVNKLEKEMLPLLDRYEDLQGKTNRSKVEQVELNKAIQTIAQTIPMAITQFDAYGRAIGISTDKAREYIKLQQLILKEKNREALNETQMTVKELEKELGYLQNTLPKTKKTLDDLYNQRRAGVKNAGAMTTDEAIASWEKGMLSLQEKIANIQDRISGNKGIIAELNGDALSKGLDNLSKVGENTSTSVPGMSEEDRKKAEKESEKNQKKALDDLKRLKEKILAIREELAMAELSGDQAEYARIKLKYEKLLKEAVGYTAQILEIKQLEGEELAQFQKRVNAAIHQEVIDGQKILMDEEQKAREARIKANQDFLNRLQEQDDDEFKSKQKQIQDQLDQDLKDQEDHQKKLQAGKKAFVEESYNLFASFADAKNQSEAKALNRELDGNEQRKKSFDQLLARKQISQAQYDQEIAKIDKQSDERKRHYAIKEANRHKALAITGAIISTIQGVARSFADYAWPYNLIVGGIIAGAGAVQVANIANQEVPLAERGMLIQGKRHSDGGTLIEAEDGEVILSRNTVQNNPGIVSSLLDSSMNRNGESIFKWSNPSISTERVLQGQQYRSSSTGNADTNSAQLMNMVQSVLQSSTNTTATAPSAPVRAFVVLKDVTEANDRYSQLRKNSGLNQ